MSVGGDERRERQAAQDAEAARDRPAVPAADNAAEHDRSADVHTRNAELLERRGSQRDADRERGDAQRERDAADGLRHPRER
jgi:hypothetical protein